MRSPLALVALLLTGCEALTGNFHTAEGTGGMGGHGAGGSEGGGVAGPCGGVDMLVDDFDDGILAPQPWTDDANSTALFTEEGGLGVARAPGGAHVFRKTLRLHDLRDSEVRLEVVEPPSTDQAYAFLQAAAGMDSIMIGGPGYGGHPNSLVVAVNGVVTSVVSFLPDAHRWWRIRQTAGEIFAEASPSGEAWTVITKVTGDEAFDVSLVQVSFGIENTHMMDDAVARFDRLNGGGAFQPNWCKAATLTDDFRAADPKPPWVRVLNTGCLLSQEAGGVVIEFDPMATGGTNGCRYVTGPAYDLRDSSLSIQLAENSIATTTESEGMLFFRVSYNETNYLEFSRPAEMVDAWVSVDNRRQLLTSVTAEASWWRFRESNGTLFWETSEDGRKWSTIFRTAHPFPLDAVDAMFGMGYATLAGASGLAKFDNFNLPP